MKIKQILKHTFESKAEKALSVELISISCPEKFKKICNTILYKGGTIFLKERLETFLDSLIIIYGENVDQVVLSYFGEEFVADNSYHINSLYSLHTDLDTAKKRGDYFCDCYMQWIMKFKTIFPRY